MSSINTEKIKILDSINLSANFNAMQNDTSYMAFIKVFNYRKMVARKFLDETDEKSRELLMALFEKCNEDIKSILGL